MNNLKTHFSLTLALFVFLSVPSSRAQVLYSSDTSSISCQDKNISSVLAKLKKLESSQQYEDAIILCIQRCPIALKEDCLLRTTQKFSRGYKFGEKFNKQLVPLLADLIKSVEPDAGSLKFWASQKLVELASSTGNIDLIFPVKPSALQELVVSSVIAQIDNLEEKEYFESSKMTNYFAEILVSISDPKVEKIEEWSSSPIEAKKVFAAQVIANKHAQIGIQKWLGLEMSNEEKMAAIKLQAEGGVIGGILYFVDEYKAEAEVQSLSSEDILNKLAATPTDISRKVRHYTKYLSQRADFDSILLKCISGENWNAARRCLRMFEEESSITWRDGVVPKIVELIVSRLKQTIDLEEQEELVLALYNIARTNPSPGSSITSRIQSPSNYINLIRRELFRRTPNSLSSQENVFDSKYDLLRVSRLAVDFEFLRPIQTELLLKRRPANSSPVDENLDLFVEALIVGFAYYLPNDVKSSLSELQALELSEKRINQFSKIANNKLIVELREFHLEIISGKKVKIN